MYWRLEVQHWLRLEVGDVHILQLSVLYEDVVGEEEGIDLPDIQSPVLVNSPLRLHIQPKISPVVVRHQPLGVIEVDLNLSDSQSCSIKSSYKNSNLFFLKRLMTTLSSAPCHRVSPEKCSSLA